MNTVEELAGDEMSAIWLILLAMKNDIDDLTKEIERVSYELESINTECEEHLGERYVEIL